MMHINVELTDARDMALWILGVMFNNDKDELNLETSPVKHVEKLLQIFLCKYSDYNNFPLKVFCFLFFTLKYPLPGNFSCRKVYDVN